MYFLDAIGGLFYFYVLLFAAALFILFIGIKMLYKGVQQKNNDMIRKAKFVLLFAVIATLCIAVVSFFVTGKIPID